MKTEVERFAKVVARFVRLCSEDAGSDNTPEQLYRVVTELIGLAGRLPDDCDEKGPDDYGLEVEQTEYRRVYAKATTIFETQFYDYTWPDGEVTTADTADDLADIYRDLKPGLDLWQRGGDEQRSGAVWAWRFNYESHWRAHAIGLHGVLKTQVRQPGLENAKLLDGEPAFFEAVVARRPDWASHIARLPSGASTCWTARLEVPSPTGDLARNFILWLNDGDPSIGFGPWHTHTETLDELWSYIEAIEGDLLVLVTDVGGPYDGTTHELELSEDDALLDYMTSPDAPPKVKIRTFTGAGDREHPL